MLRISSHSPAETRRLGARLGALLQEGDVILLEGDLGAGKTCFAQGIGAGLRVREPVKSSSFVLVNEYHGRLKVYHADLFRLNDASEIVDLGLEENSADGVLLIEWPDRAMTEMPPEHLRVRFEIESDRHRQIAVSGSGARYVDLLERLAGSNAK